MLFLISREESKTKKREVIQRQRTSVSELAKHSLKITSLKESALFFILDSLVSGQHCRLAA